jgi:predicted cupin superfamily sugar epimerase
MPQVMLDWPQAINDHTRPEVEGVARRMWRMYAYPGSALEVLLWMDGRTQVVSTLYDRAYMDADANAHHQMVFEDTDWQVPVLEAAGYTLVPVEAAP